MTIFQEKKLPAWGKDLDWGYLPIHHENARATVTCDYGEKHEIQVPACRAVSEESKTYGKRRLVQCERPAGHDGEHSVMTDIVYFHKWKQAKPFPSAAPQL